MGEEIKVKKLPTVYTPERTCPLLSAVVDEILDRLILREKAVEARFKKRFKQAEYFMHYEL